LAPFHKENERVVVRVPEEVRQRLACPFPLLSVGRLQQMPMGELTDILIHTSQVDALESPERDRREHSQNTPREHHRQQRHAKPKRADCSDKLLRHDWMSL
jgi:hypothetical protein